MKNFFRNTIFFTIFTALMFSASCGAVKDCDQTGLMFYNCLKTKNFVGILPLLDSEAVKNTPQKVWIDGLKHKDSDLGTVLNVKRIDFETVTEKLSTRVGILYKVVYSGAVLFEKLEFIEREDGYKITFYRFNEDSTLVY